MLLNNVFSLFKQNDLSFAAGFVVFKTKSRENCVGRPINSCLPLACEENVMWEGGKVRKDVEKKFHHFGGQDWHYTVGGTLHSTTTS